MVPPVYAVKDQVASKAIVRFLVCHPARHILPTIRTMIHGAGSTILHHPRDVCGFGAATLNADAIEVQCTLLGIEPLSGKDVIKG